MDQSISSDYMLKPGQVIHPEVSIEVAQRLIKDHFGFDVKRITELNSYDDKNFLVEASPAGNKGTNQPPRKFVFKVLNSMDSKKQHVIAENSAMLFLKSTGISCPVPEPSLQGSTSPLVDIESQTDVDNNAQVPGTGKAGSRSHVIRLLSFVEGQILSEVQVNEGLLYDVGIYAAQLLENLKKFEHPGLDNHRSIWLLCSTPCLTQFIYVIQSETDKFKMVSEVLEAFSSRVVPAYSTLQKGVIHGDLNEQNILVQNLRNDSDIQESFSRQYAVSGVIDFGDLQHNFYVFELAILMTYMMLECLKTDIDPLEGSAHVLAGFMSKHHVPQNELELLRVCICSRLCQSVVLGRYSYTLAPANDYLLTTATNGWILLDRLWNQSTDEQLLAIWRKVIPQITQA